MFNNVRCARRRSTLSTFVRPGILAVGVLIAATSTGDPAAASVSKSVRVAWTSTATASLTGQPLCETIDCALTIGPATVTFSGRFAASGPVASGATLKTGDLNGVTVAMTVQGAVKGCRPGRVVLVAMFDDIRPKTGWSGIWRVVTGSGRDGFDGSVGQGELKEREGAGQFKRIDYSGTISCQRA